MITLKEYAKRHGKELISVRQKAQRGGFKSARKLGRDWFIDEDEPYQDNRVKTGAYKDWRKARANADNKIPHAREGASKGMGDDHEPE